MHDVKWSVQQRFLLASFITVWPRFPCFFFFFFFFFFYLRLSWFVCVRIVVGGDPHRHAGVSSRRGEGKLRRAWDFKRNRFLVHAQALDAREINLFVGCLLRRQFAHRERGRG